MSKLSEALWRDFMIFAEYETKKRYAEPVGYMPKLKPIKRWIGAKKDRNAVKVRNVRYGVGVEVDDINFRPGSDLMRLWFTK